MNQCGFVCVIEACDFDSAAPRSLIGMREVLAGFLDWRWSMRKKPAWQDFAPIDDELWTSLRLGR